MMNNIGPLNIFTNKPMCKVAFIIYETANI